MWMACVSSNFHLLGWAGWCAIGKPNSSMSHWLCSNVQAKTPPTDLIWCQTSVFSIIPIASVPIPINLQAAQCTHLAATHRDHFGFMAAQCHSPSLSVMWQFVHCWWLIICLSAWMFEVWAVQLLLWAQQDGATWLFGLLRADSNMTLPFRWHLWWIFVSEDTSSAWWISSRSTHSTPAEAVSETQWRSLWFGTWERLSGATGCRGMALHMGLVDCWILDSLKPRLTRIFSPWTCSRILQTDPLQPLSHPTDFRNRPLIIYSELHRTQGIVLILLRRRCEFWIWTSKPVTRRWTSE